MVVSSQGSRQSVAYATYCFKDYNDEGYCIATNMVRLLSSVLSSTCNYNHVDCLYRMATVTTRVTEVSVGVVGEWAATEIGACHYTRPNFCVSRHYLLLCDI